MVVTYELWVSNDNYEKPLSTCLQYTQTEILKIGHDARVLRLLLLILQLLLL